MKGVSVRAIGRVSFSVPAAALLGAAALWGFRQAAPAAWREALPGLHYASAVLPWLVLLLVLGVVECRLVVALFRARVRPVPAGRAVGGTAVIEFAMLFPIAVMVLMIMVQLALLMQGNLLVNYAAYAAARSAVVQIPEEYPGEGRNELAPAGWKMERIRRAAVLALTPVSGRIPPETAGLNIQADLRTLYEQSGETPRAGLARAFAEKFTYADRHTRIVEVGPPQGQGVFTSRQPVEVTIEHDLVLGVPFARAIFADGSFRDAEGNTHYYTTVEACYKLTNEGPRLEPEEPYCPQPPPRPPGPWHPPHTGCPYH